MKNSEGGIQSGAAPIPPWYIVAAGVRSTKMCEYPPAQESGPSLWGHLNGGRADSLQKFVC